jgi:hypothetical protein
MTGKRLRVRKRALFRQLGYKPHPGQVLVHRSKAKRRVLACGTRWGKSLCASMEGVAALLQPCEESRGWIVAPTYNLCGRTFLIVESAIRKHWPHRLVASNTKERRVIVRNLGGGLSELACKSADRPVGLLGAALDWMIVDEAARLRDDVWQRFLSPRLIDRDGWALLVSTPTGTNWFYREFRRGLRREPGFESWSSPSSDNPHLPEGVIEEERERMAEDVYEQEYLAQFAGAQTEPCLVCGGPSRDVPMVHITTDRASLGECPECGEVVDAEGRTIVHRTADGQAVVRVIDLSWDGVEPERALAADV